MLEQRKTVDRSPVELAAGKPLHQLWNAALDRFNFTKATMDATPLDDFGGDVAVDLYCEAMDDLMTSPAPDAEALFVKFRLTRARFERDSIPTPPEYQDAFEADVRRLLGQAGPAFDASDWIQRATDAGATMFVRDDELWVGQLASEIASPVIRSLQAELDDDKRQAIRDVLAARGLICMEA